MIDALIVAGYLGLMVTLGWRSRNQSADSYWVAERRYGTRRITASLVATVFGASATLGIIGLGYTHGLTGAWWALIGALALLVLGLALAARVRSLKVYTLPDILARAYGKSVSVPAAVMIVISWCGIVAAQMIAGARLVGGILPLDYGTALAGIAIVFVVYTYWGGQLSVIRTDYWQFGLFLGGLIICVVLAMVSVGGRLASAPTDHWSFPVSASFGWYDLVVFYPLIVGLPYLVGPDIYSRIFSARDASTAKRSILWAALAMIPISFVLALLGILIRISFPDVAPDAALPTALSGLAPIGLVGLITAGFLAAVMSSADTTLVSAATIFSLNLAGAGARMSQDQQLRLTRVAVLVIGFVAWLIAQFQGGIISSLLLGYTVFVGGVVMPTLASFCKPALRVTRRGAMWSVIVGGTTALIGGIGDGTFVRSIMGNEVDAQLASVLGSRYTSIAPILIGAVVMLSVSYLDRDGLEVSLNGRGGNGD